MSSISAPSSPAREPRRPKSVICSGTTIKDLPCRNKVKVIPSRHPGTDSSYKTYCHVHKDQAKNDNAKPRPVSERPKEEGKTDSIVKLEPSTEAADLGFESVSTRTRRRQTINAGGQRDDDDDKVQCSSATSKGTQCKVQVKLRLPWSFVDSKSPPTRQCWQHRDKKDIQKEGFESRRTKEMVIFSDYIPSGLSRSTRASLQKEMEKPPPVNEQPGFVYGFQIEDPDKFIVKVGWTSGDLTRRLGQWKKDCPLKKQKLLGWWPGNIMDKNFKKTTVCSRYEPGSKGVYARKVERLVHLELADIVLLAIRKSENPLGDLNEDSETPSAISALQRANGRCSCGTKHKEIFSFVRPKMNGKETDQWDKRVWEELVMPIIYKWGWFMTLFW